MDLNKIILAGRVTGKPEIQTTPSGTSVAKFSLATNKKWKDKQGNKKEKTTFFNLVAWGGVVKVIADYIVIGHEILVEGSVDNRTYEKKDGTKGYISEVIIEKLQLGQKPKGLETNNNNNDYEERKKESEETLPTIDEDEIDIKDIPF